jgi:spermidine/putrescine transport system ATP-binding protein
MGMEKSQEYDVVLRNVIKEFPSGGTLVRAVNNVNIDFIRGEFFALLGPSGCGKTTTLRMIAGFEQPSSGEIIIRGKAVQGIPPFHRPVNTVFQDYALFPHMTILDNVKFGLQMEKTPDGEALKRAREALEMVRLPNVENRRPHQLSGGQQQRVALARALVKRPAVLLLDEPLGALDLKLRKQMQVELKSMQQDLGITFIFVTHDQEEAMTMADRIAVMDKGEVLQIGSGRDIYERPATQFVADFIGETNFIPGVLEEIRSGIGAVRLPDGTVVEAKMPDEHTIDLGEVLIPVRPERIALLPIGADLAYYKSPNMTLLNGTVVDVDYIGTDTRYEVMLPGNIQVAVRQQNVDYGEDYEFEKGQDVQVFWPLQSTYLLDQ